MPEPLPDTVAAIEAVQRLAQSVIDEHSGEEDAQASVYDDMAIAEAPIRWAQTHVCSAPDADLDAIERTLGTRTEVECPRCGGSGEEPDLSDCTLCLGNCAVAANSPEAMESLARWLLARVRTAETQRDRYRFDAEHLVEQREGAAQ